MKNNEILELASAGQLTVLAIKKATLEARERVLSDLRITGYFSGINHPLPRLTPEYNAIFLAMLETSTQSTECTSKLGESFYPDLPQDRPTQCQEGAQKPSQNLTSSHDEEHPQEINTLSPEHPISILAQSIFDRFYKSHPNFQP